MLICLHLYCTRHRVALLYLHFHYSLTYKPSMTSERLFLKRPDSSLCVYGATLRFKSVPHIALRYLIISFATLTFNYCIVNLLCSFHLGLAHAPNRPSEQFVGQIVSRLLILAFIGVSPLDVVSRYICSAHSTDGAC